MGVAHGFWRWRAWGIVFIRFDRNQEETMYNKLLVPLDGSKTAENVLPYARALAGALRVPVELLELVDISAISLGRSCIDDHALRVADGSRDFICVRGPSRPGCP